MVLAKFKNQYEEKRAVLVKTGILEVSKKGELSITGIDGIRYPFPAWSVIEKALQENKFVRKKILQGFSELDIVPFALPLGVLLKKTQKVIIGHFEEGKLFGTKKDEQDKKEKLVSLELNKREALWCWEGYKNADTKGVLLYQPLEFTRENHQGQTKGKILDMMKKSLFPGYLITLNEENVNIPVKGTGKVILGRKQLEAGYTAKQYLEMLYKQEMYLGEKGQTPEEWLTRFILFLEKNNQVIDDYQAWGSASYQIGVYFPKAGVPHARWSRLYKQAHLGRYNPVVGYGNMGTRFVVRLA